VRYRLILSFRRYNNAAFYAKGYHIGMCLKNNPALVAGLPSTVLSADGVLAGAESFKVLMDAAADGSRLKISERDANRSAFELQLSNLGHVLEMLSACSAITSATSGSTPQRRVRGSA